MGGGLEISLPWGQGGGCLVEIFFLVRKWGGGVLGGGFGDLFLWGDVGRCRKRGFLVGAGEFLRGYGGF